MNEQFYGIKFPFNEEGKKKSFFDLNETYEDGVRSMLLHIIFTPKGQRLRQPNFGTNLIKYIFEPSDEFTWESLKTEIKGQISLYLPCVTFNNIKILTNESENRDVFIEVDYSILKNGKNINNKTVVKL